MSSTRSPLRAGRSAASISLREQKCTLSHASFIRWIGLGSCAAHVYFTYSARPNPESPDRIHTLPRRADARARHQDFILAAVLRPTPTQPIPAIVRLSLARDDRIRPP